LSSMAKYKLSIALLMISILVTIVLFTPLATANPCSPSQLLPMSPSIAAQCQWKDISPNAYLSPPANPPLDSVYMFPASVTSPVEGWAVGESAPLTDATTSLPSIFHYDGSVWNLVPAPKYPDFPSTQCPYDLTSVNFGTPNNAISKNDGWAVGVSHPAVSPLTATVTSTAATTTTSSATTSQTVTSTSYTPATTTATVTATSTSTVTAISSVSVSTTVVTVVSTTVSSTITSTSTSTVATTIPGSAVDCGGGSVAIHWDGVTWRVQVAGLMGPGAGTLNSVFMVSPTDVWAVGSDKTGTTGSIWHWTGVPGLGGGWNLVMSVPQVLHSVFMVSPTDGWAVGDAGAIYHYFAGAWTAFSSPFPPCPQGQFCTLYSVFMISPTDGWIVGTNGNILHYTAGTWSGPVSPGTTSNDLFSVFMSSSTEGWAVGGSALGQTQETIVHYSGGTWTALPINLIPLSPVNAFSLNSVFFTTAANGWAVGTAGAIINFDGNNWGAVTSPTLNNFTSISFGPPLVGPINPNDGWAVGNASRTNPLEPTIYHWNGFMWTRGVAIGATNDLNSVYMLNGGDVWAVGGGPHPTASCSASPIALCPIILHFTGGSWNTVTPPPGTYTLKSVFMVSPMEGWAVGEQTGLPSPTGIILHYTVTGGVGTWAIFPAPSSPSAPGGLNSVFMLGPNEGWAVGDMETILHYTVTGGVGTWNVVTVSGTPMLSQYANLTSIFMLSPTSGWAVGGIQTPPAVGSSISAGPVIIYWDGTKWTPVATPSIPGGISPTGHTSATLKSVFCSDPNNCWASGFPGKLFATLFHFDGVAWTHVSTIPALLGQVPPILTSIYLMPDGSGWIVGSDPEFPYPSLAQQPLPGTTTTALSTILRCFQGLAAGTATTTIVSTVATQTTLLTGITTSVSTLLTTVTSTNTTVVAPITPSGNIIPVIVGIIAALAVALVLILLLLGRRRPRAAPVVCYPIQRRPC
jgi:photosystem II stability/assembly factor-like uncharacterized protein